MQQMSSTKSSNSYKICTGVCPDPKCEAKLSFPAHDSSIECTQCGQCHEKSSLKMVNDVTDPTVSLHNIIRNALLENTVPKKGAEMIKVLGLSNYHCKLLSPFLSHYGMDKSGKAKPLTELNQPEAFDCGILGDRAFLIQPDHINVTGYGRDISGSETYLKDTLEMVKSYNDGEERLVPLHADGDGHCLVHAISRALIGRELFWHPLRCNLKSHFQQKMSIYKALFSDFIDAQEWITIVNECDPDFHPPDGDALGLRNIHIFGLANVLRRPIILFDSLSGMESFGDYSALFLPTLVDPADCTDKSGIKRKPLCLAWSSSGRNHYIPLIGIKGVTLPKLPSHMIPKSWGVEHVQMFEYIDFVDDMCIIGGEKCLPDSYILRLASAMDELYLQKHDVHPVLVADVQHYVYKRTGVAGVKSTIVVDATREAVHEDRLFRCLTCGAVCEMKISLDWLKKDGCLHNQVVEAHGNLSPVKLYSFPSHNLVCTYNASLDELVPNTDSSRNQSVNFNECNWCRSTHLRKLKGDGNVVYINGDKTKNKSVSSLCKCGFKHYWDGKEYDNIPLKLGVTLELAGQVIHDQVAWFQYESDPSLNSNVYEVASSVVQKHFPDVFGCERLIQKVVDQILAQTSKTAPSVLDEDEVVDRKSTLVGHSANESSPQKTVLAGHRILHEEELTLCDTEKKIREKIKVEAPLNQNKSAVQLKTANTVNKPNLKTTDESKDLSANRNLNSHPGKGVKLIKVTTSDGRQAQMKVTTEITFESLQEYISTELEIPPSKQKIKHGFPPRIFEPPDEPTDPIPLQHGDRIIVEIIGELMDKEENVSSEKALMEESSHVQDALLKRLSALQRTDGDALDQSLATLFLSATLSGKVIWDYVCDMPYLFTHGGLFYEQVRRDVGLEDGKHCQLTLIPDKMFRYNAKHDRLELCLEPKGHFPVSRDVDKIMESGDKSLSNDPHGSISRSTTSLFTETARALSVGSSGVVVNKSMKVPDNVVSFQGTGRTLGNVGENSDVIKTRDGVLRVDKDCVESSEKELMRKGPGFSVLASNSQKEFANDAGKAINSCTSDDTLQDFADNSDNKDSHSDMEIP